mgnify:CR=1 FL=1|tara:strand:+ start:5548 stop:6261 length:714 start_codon:yes stop_codon:yes gene_type:complete
MEKVIFIDIPKCATTSIYKVLHENFWDENGNYLHKHIPLSMYPEHIRTTTKIVTCVRNPYDRMVSIWKYYNKLKSTWHEIDPGTPSAKNDVHRISALAYVDRVKYFSKFVDDCYNKNQDIEKAKSKGLPGEFKSGMDIVIEAQRILRAFNEFPYNDVFKKSMTSMLYGPPTWFTIRYEHLQKDVNTLCEKLNWPKVNIPKINVSGGPKYLDYYNKETLKKVNYIFYWDFLNCGYKMK